MTAVLVPTIDPKVYFGDPGPGPSENAPYCPVHPDYCMVNRVEWKHPPEWVIECPMCLVPMPLHMAAALEVHET